MSQSGGSQTEPELGTRGSTADCSVDLGGSLFDPGMHPSGGPSSWHLETGEIPLTEWVDRVPGSEAARRAQGLCKSQREPVRLPEHWNAGTMLEVLSSGPPFFTCSRLPSKDVSLAGLQGWKMAGTELFPAWTSVLMILLVHFIANSEPTVEICGSYPSRENHKKAPSLTPLSLITSKRTRPRGGERQLWVVRHPSVSKDYGSVLCMEGLEQRLVWLRRPIRE